MWMRVRNSGLQAKEAFLKKGRWNYVYSNEFNQVNAESIADHYITWEHTKTQSY